MSNIHSLFPNLVRLTEDTHQYFDSQGKEYMSFSRFKNEFITEKFNKEMIAKMTAKRDGIEAADVIADWDSRRDAGTRTDKALEIYSLTGKLPSEYADLEEIVKLVLSKYKHYNVCYEQVVVYSKEFRTAGSIDKTCIISNRKTSGFHLGDFKQFDNGMSYEPKGTKWMNVPFDHMVNSKWNGITCQLSFYAYHLEQLTGRKCERLFVDMIKPIKDAKGNMISYENYVIPIQYIKPQIEYALNKHKDKILEILEPIQQTIILNEEGYF